MCEADLAWTQRLKLIWELGIYKIEILLLFRGLDLDELRVIRIRKFDELPRFLNPLYPVSEPVQQTVFRLFFLM